EIYPRGNGQLGSGTRSIILDHAYRIAAAHSASLDHPRAILGHSRDFHSSGGVACTARTPRIWRSWIYRSFDRES
ncbi:hypothetical protein X777_05501, partial [Ooceraea biroi]